MSLHEKKQEINYQNYNIRKTIKFDNFSIILLSIPNNSTELYNLYKVTNDGTIIWKISENESLGKKIKNPLPFENMEKIDENQVLVSDFYGRNFTVDIEQKTISFVSIAK